MKAIKRTIASLLATLMFVSCFSFNVAFGAEEYTDEQAIAVSKVNAASIMTGTENGFEPSKTLTRAEAAAIVVRMKGIPESQISSAKGNTLFTDVPASSWAAGYINAASSMNIISGVGNGLFQPDREVTVIEFVAMATRALGAGKLVDSIGTWPTNYVNFASEEKLLDGVLKVYTAPATRMDVAFMVVNTLEADMWEKSKVTNTNEVTYEKTGKTILGSVLEITEYENLDVTALDTKERTVTFDGTGSAVVNAYDVVDSVEIATLKAGMEVDVWVKAEDKEIIRIAPAEKAKTNSVAFTAIKKIDNTNDKITLVVNGKEVKYKYSTVTDKETTFSYNTLTAPSKVDDSTDSELANDEGEKLVVSDNIFGTAVLDGDTITAIYAEEYDLRGVVEKVKNDTIYFESTSKVPTTVVTGHSKIDTDAEDYEYVVTKNGKEIDITDVEEGDAIYFYEDTDNAKRLVMVVNNNIVEGEVTKLSSKRYVEVEGEQYDLVKALKGAGVQISSGDQVKLFLNGKNEIVMYQVIDGAVDSTLALVKELRATSDKYGKQQLEIVLVQLDGTVLDTMTVDLTETAEKFKTAKTPVAALDTPLEVVQVIYDAQATADKFNTSATYAESIVGQMIRYTLKGGKVVIRELASNTSYDEAKVKALDGTGAYNENSAKLGGKYYLDDNTVIYVAKRYASTADEYEYACKFEQVAFEDFGTSSGLTGYLYGVNKNTSKVSAVLFSDATKVSRTTENTYAFVLDYSDNYDDPSEEDYDATAKLLLADGSVASVIVNESCPTFARGDVVEVFIDGDKLDEVVDFADFEGDEKSVRLNMISITDGILWGAEATYSGDPLALASIASAQYELADKFIVAELQEDGSYKPASEGSLPDVVEEDLDFADKATYDADKEITAYLVKNTDTAEFEIIAFVYADQE